MGGDGGAPSKLKKMARKLIFFSCASMCSSRHADPRVTPGVSLSATNLGQEQEMPLPLRRARDYMSDAVEEGECVANVPSKNLCAICLEPLLNSNATSPGQAVFTSQCSHSFHLSCISSNIRHGSITCPICRAQWTRLPRTLHPPCWLPRNQDDPIIRILDDSITTFRVHRRSFLRTARYNDDDPVEPEAHMPCHSRLCLNLIPLNVPQTPSASEFCSCVLHLSPSPYHSPRLNSHECMTGSVSPWYKHKRPAYLSVRLASQQPIDLVLVASPNGPHLRLLKQCMSLAVFSLRSVDRLAIVSYSSAAARIFPLRRMTSYGKQAALQVIDRLFYAGHADPMEGIKKGIKILRDRTHENPHSSILHLSDYPTTSRSYRAINDMEMGMPVSVYQFNVASTSSIMHKLEEFLGQLIVGVVREVQLSIEDEDEGRVVRLGELRGDEERRVFLEVDESRDHVCISYSYTEGSSGIDACVRVGEAAVGIDDGGRIDDVEAPIAGGRTSCVDSWDYHDPCMARRWAKRLHGRHRTEARAYRESR